MKVHLRCYAGGRAEEIPRKLVIGEKELTVQEIVYRWLAPDHRYFKLRCEDQGIYIVRYDERADRWELTVFERSGSALADAPR